MSKDNSNLQNQNAKKVRFNGMDAFICIILVLAVAAAVCMFGGKGTGTKSSAKDTTVNVAVELTSIDEDVAKSIKEGDIVALGEKDKAMATVSKVEIEPAKTLGFDIVNGRVYNTEVPRQYDAKIYMTAKGLETDSAITIDTVVMRVGQAMVLSAKGWAGHGYTIELSADNQ